MREMLADFQLSNYDFIIMDEAHERTLNGDIILGMLKRLVGQGRDLKVIICSATFNVQQFSEYFFNCPIL